MNQKIITLSSAIAAIISLSALQHTHAAGFQTQQQNATGMGRTWAGEGIIGDNASIQFYNPAAMTLLKKTEFSLGLNYVAPDSTFNHEKTTIAAGGTTIASTDSTENASPAVNEITGNNGGNFGNSAVIPFGYIVVPFAEKFRAGLGIYTKFGIGTSYDDEFYGRYHGTKSDLTTIFFTPSLAYEINKQWSIGASVSVVKADAELEKAIPDFSGSPNPYAGDGDFSKIEGDDTGFGWSIGATYALSDNTRFGLNYNSEIDLTLEGKVTLRNNDNAFATAALFPAGANSLNGTVDLTLPQQLSLDAYHRIHNFAVHGTLAWVGWSSFKEIRINQTEYAPSTLTALGSPLGETIGSPETHNWDDSYRISIGGTYYLNSIWELRAGIQWDQSPIPAEYRTVRIPADDRWNFGLGFTAYPTNYFSIDLGYVYAYQDNAKVTQTSNLNSAGTVTTTTTGEAEIGIHVVGLQTNFRF